MVDRKYSLTPGEKLDFQVDYSSLLLNKAEIDLFHSQVAKLLCLAERTRCDLLFQVSPLASKVKAPTVKNRIQLDIVFGYLKGTPDRGINYDGGGEMKRRVYADASFMIHEDLISSHNKTLGWSESCVKFRRPRRTRENKHRYRYKNFKIVRNISILLLRLTAGTPDEPS